MTMLRFGPLLAIAGAACLVAWTPEGRLRRPKSRALDRAPASRFDAPATETASVAGRGAIARRRAGRIDRVWLSRRSAGADPPRPALSRRGHNASRPVRLRQPRGRGARARSALRRSPAAAVARLPRAVSRLRGAPEPSAPAAEPGLAARRRPFLRPRSCTGRAMSRASGRSPPRPMTRPSDRRSNGRLCAPTRIRPSRRSPPSLRLIRAGQAAAGFASGRKPNSLRIRWRPAKVAAYFAGEPPQSSAGKIAAARAAQAMGRAEEASQIIRALWRDGQFRRPDRERHLARIRRFAHQGRPRLSGRPPALRRLPRRWRPRCGACRARRLWRSPRPASRRLARR